MKIATNDSDDDNNNEPLDMSEQETLRQHGDGPAPDCLRFLEETIRFPITILKGRYLVDNNGHWLRHCPESTS